MRLLTIFIAAILLTGCASVKKQSISQESKGGLKDQTVSYTKRPKPDFVAMTPTKGAFALIGAIAAISDGNSIISKYDVADPADTISSGLLSALQESHSMHPVNEPVSVTTDDVTRIAAGARGRSTYVVDVQTLNWSFLYFPLNWNRYRVIYTAKVRLIDSNTQTVVAEGFCKRMPESDSGAPTYDDLINENATGLKKELNTAAEECITAMKAEMLSI